MVLRASVRVDGAAEVRRALRRLPEQGRRALVRRSNELAYNLLRRQRRAAARHSRQAARAATTLKVVRSREFPTVTAGPHVLLFGSEFGVKRRFGWYEAARYRRSAARQFAPHRGNDSYWFFRAQEEARPAIEAAWTQARDDTIRAWGA